MSRNNPVRLDFSPAHFTSIIRGGETSSGRDPSFERLARDIGDVLSEASFNEGLAEDAHEIARTLRRANSATDLWTMFASGGHELAERPMILPIKAALLAARALITDGLDKYIEIRDEFAQASQSALSSSQLGPSEPVLEAARAIAEQWHQDAPDKYWDNAQDFLCEGIGSDVFYGEIFQTCSLRQSELARMQSNLERDAREPALPVAVEVELRLSTAVAARCLVVNGLEEYENMRNHLVERFRGRLTERDIDSSSHVLAAAQDLARNLVRCGFKEYKVKTQELIDAGIGNSELYSHVYFSNLARGGWGT